MALSCFFPDREEHAFLGVIKFFTSMIYFKNIRISRVYMLFVIYS